MVGILKEILTKRRSSLAAHADILDQLMRNEDLTYKLTDEQIIDQIITFLYSGYETVSTATMMAVKYLHDNYRVLEEVRVSPNTLKKSFLLLGRIIVLNVNFYLSTLVCRKSILQSSKERDQRM